MVLTYYISIARSMTSSPLKMSSSEAGRGLWGSELPVFTSVLTPKLLQIIVCDIFAVFSYFVAVQFLGLPHLDRSMT